jgi:hypothetical protein
LLSAHTSKQKSNCNAILMRKFTEMVAGLQQKN